MFGGSALGQIARCAALRVRDKVLILTSMLWGAQVRAAGCPVLDEAVRISAKERAMAKPLVDALAADFEPERFTDDYQEQLRTLVQAKLEKGDSVDTGATFGESETSDGDDAEVVDLMEALRSSVDRKKSAAKTAKKETAKPAKKAARRQQ